ncbi:MAG: hypothetical protein ACBR50_17740 [Microcoleus sp.]
MEEVPDILCCLPDRTTHTKTVQFAKTRGDKTQVEMASLWDGEISDRPFESRVMLQWIAGFADVLSDRLNQHKSFNYY